MDQQAKYDPLQRRNGVYEDLRNLSLDIALISSSSALLAEFDKTGLLTVVSE